MDVRDVQDMRDVPAVVLYLRVSQDRTGEELSVSRQREDALRLAELRGWRVVAEFTDNDISASGKRRRPGFDAMLTAIASGQAQCVIAWDLSRLTRNSRDRLRLLEVGKERGATIALVRGSDMDLSTPAGRLTADILGSVAQHEIEQKSDRQRRAVVQAAAAGRRVGGRRPFGYEQDGMTVREIEAGPIRTAYADVLAGVGLGTIARRWNRAGLSTPQCTRWTHGCEQRCAAATRASRCPRRIEGGEASGWTSSSVRTLLINPRYAGLRARVEGVAGNPRAARLAGITGKALWPALVGEATFWATVALLTDPARATRSAPRSGQRLLTGLAHCGVCDATVHSGGATQGYPAYRCSAAQGHIGRASGPCDWWITELVIGRLSRPDAGALLVRTDGPDAARLEQQARDLRTALDGLATLLVEKVLTIEGVRRESARLNEQLAHVETQQADAGKVSALAGLVGADDVRARWDELDTDRRRAAIGVLMRVTLLPPGRGVAFGQDERAWEAKVERVKATIRVDWK